MFFVFEIFFHDKPSLRSNRELSTIKSLSFIFINCTPAPLFKVGNEEVSKTSNFSFFDTAALPTLNKGAGVQLMKIKGKDFIVDSSLFDLKQGLSWSKASKTKNFKDVQFWLGKRAQVGKKIPKGFNKNLKFNS